eukprot:450016-Pelagomonas_calceolata.AAC.6
MQIITIAALGASQRVSVCIEQSTGPQNAATCCYRRGLFSSWAVPSGSTRWTMVCPGSSAAAIAATSPPHPTCRGPRILPLVQASHALKVMWVKLLPIQASWQGGGCQHALALHTSGSSNCSLAREEGGRRGRGERV